MSKKPSELEKLLGLTCPSKPKRKSSFPTGQSAKSKNSSKQMFSTLSKTSKTAKNVANSKASTEQKVKAVLKTGHKIKNLRMKIIFYAVLWVVLLATIPFSNKIEKSLNSVKFNFSATVAGQYRVHFVDVGQGDATIVELPDNKILMIDTGPSSGRNNLVNYINSLNIDVIDYLILTHTDADHVGNAVAVFDLCEVKTTFMPKVYSNFDVENGLNVKNYKIVTTQVWSNAVRAIYNEKCEVLYNFANKLSEKNLNFGSDEFGYSVEFFAPLQDEFEDVNDYCPFVLVNLQNTKFMFTGDAGRSVEQDFLKEYPAQVELGYFDCDVLKVGHHGSEGSSCEKFLNVIKPEIAIVSCGKNNKYYHPNKQTVDRLESVNATIKRTDMLGSIVLEKSNNSTPQNVVSNENFNHVDDFYLEWKMVLIGGAILLVALAVVLFVRQKRAQN